MLTVNKLLPGGRGLAPRLVARAASIELDWDTRQKSRFEGVDSAGRTLGVFLARGTQLRGGDVLVAEDGSLVRVVASPQPVLLVQAPAGDALALLRAAYHLGNRHVQLEVRADRLQLEPDPVLAEMLRRMGLDMREAHAPFEPEGGAYGAHGQASGAAHDVPHAHAHDHAHDHEHEHEQKHEHAHAHAQGHEHERGHAQGHGHEHAHGHAGGHGHEHAHGHEHGPAHPAAHEHGPGCDHA